MYLVYGSTEYNKEIHAVMVLMYLVYGSITRRYIIGTNLVYGSTEYNIHVVIGTNVLSVWVYRI